MSAVYTNAIAGTTTDSPLASGATTINSAAFAYLPTVASPDFAWITLDPTGVAGLPEIVKVTAHTAATTTCTIVRGQQAVTNLTSAGRSHLVNTIWRHSATKADLDNILAATPAGTIRATINSSADAGWLLFNQTVVGAQTLYPALWAVAPAGWKSAANLVLPNLANTVITGAGTIALGASGGANSKTITANNLPTHTHPVTVTDPSHSHVEVSYGSAGASTGIGDSINLGGPVAGALSTSTSTTGITAAATANTTTATALDVTPLSLALTYQIKAH